MSELNGGLYKNADQALTDKLAEVESLLVKLKGLRPLNEGEIRRLREDFIIGNTYNSNAIEGSSLTLRETALILQQGMTIAEKPLREHLDAIGFRDAFYYVAELAGQGQPMSEPAIKNIHSLVLMNDRDNRGKYRNVPVIISGALQEPPQPCLVPEHMERLIACYPEWLRTEPLISAIARFHLEFEAVHPFIDGNGRVGRLLLNLELIKHGLLPIDIKFTDRAKYYSCFDSCHTAGNNPAALTALIADYEISELKRYISFLTEVFI